MQTEATLKQRIKSDSIPLLLFPVFKLFIFYRIAYSLPFCKDIVISNLLFS